MLIQEIGEILKYYLVCRCPKSIVEVSLEEHNNNHNNTYNNNKTSVSLIFFNYI